MEPQRLTGNDTVVGQKLAVKTTVVLTKCDITLVFVIAVYLLGVIICTSALLFMPYGNDLLMKIVTVKDPRFSFYSLSFSVTLAGLLGGALYAATGLYRRLADLNGAKVTDSGTDFNIRIWLFWYIFRPFQSGVLAAITLALLNAGFVGLTNIKSVNTQSLYFQISLGFLVGYGTHEVLQKLDEIIKVTFSTSKSTKSTVQDDTKCKVMENEQTKGDPSG